MGREINGAARIDPATQLPIGYPVDGKQAEGPQKITLHGRLVRLEPLDLAVHGDALWPLLGGEDKAALWLYMGDGPFEDRAAFERAVEHALSEYPFLYAIVNLSTGMAEGWGAFLNIRPAQGVIEVGYLMFSALLQRTAAATEALYLMTRYAFDELGFRRYEWKCNSLNAKSRAAAERIGFEFEGVFRRHMIVKGRNRDTAWYSITADEWPEVKKRLETWLGPGNFDNAGKQLTPLQKIR